MPCTAAAGLSNLSSARAGPTGTRSQHRWWTPLPSTLLILPLGSAPKRISLSRAQRRRIWPSPSLSSKRRAALSRSPGAVTQASFPPHSQTLPVANIRWALMPPRVPHTVPRSHTRSTKPAGSLDTLAQVTQKTPQTGSRIKGPISSCNCASGMMRWRSLTYRLRTHLPPLHCLPLRVRHRLRSQP